MSGWPRTHRAVINDDGGVRGLAAKLGYELDRVRSWRDRDSIPAGLWPGVIAVTGVTFKELQAAAKVRKGEALSPGDLPDCDDPVALERLIPAGPVDKTTTVAARARLDNFCRAIDVPGVSPRRKGDPPLLAAHHRLWLEKLADIERGKIRRLMGFMPPGSAKSTYAVDVFTPWFLGRQANRSVLVVTYATALAARRGRRARGVTRQPAFAAILGVRPDKARASAVDWGLDNGSDWMGAGMLAGITGNRADLIVIDDPVKGRAEADSPLIRQRTREEFDDTVRTRLKAGGRIVLIQTRWHEDDLAGSLLPADYDGASGPVLCRDLGGGQHPGPGRAGG